MCEYFGFPTKNDREMRLPPIIHPWFVQDDSIIFDNFDFTKEMWAQCVMKKNIHFISKRLNW